MTPQDFTNWLKGYLQLEQPESLGPTEVAIIREHLFLVLKKETSSFGMPLIEYKGIPTTC